MKNTQAGFVSILLIIAAVLVIGGGSYYVATKNKSEVRNEKAEENAQNENVQNENAQAKQNSSGSLKSLFSIGRDVFCIVENTDASASSKGTVYISGENMRGDFVSTTAQGTVTSSIIKKGDDMFVWSGTQGVKMSFTESEKAAGQVNANQSAAVDLNQNVSYECNDWNPEAAKFVAPASVSFLDMKALIDLQGSVKIPKY